MNFGKTLKKYLIPSQENDFKPHFLRSETVSIFIILIFVVELAMVGQSIILSKKTDFLALVAPSVLVDLANSDRSQNNVGSLQVNPQLQEAAQLKANDMAAKGYFAHVTPEGYQPWYWLDQVGYTYDYAGENLAVNFFDSADVEKAWMNSPTHRENIVKPQYTQVGIAMASGMYEGKNTIFVVQFFGTPKSTSPAPEVAIASPTPSVSPTLTAIASPKPTHASTPKPSATSVPVVAQTTPSVSPTLMPTLDATAAPTIPADQLAEVKAAETSTVQPTSPSLIIRLLTSPRELDRWILGMLLAIVLAALSLAVLIEVRVQHKQIIANGLGLIIVIGLGFILNTHLFTSDVTIPQNAGSTTASINTNY